MKGYFVASYDQFIRPVIAELQANGIQCELTRAFDKRTAPLCDFIWVDFATENAILVQQYLTSAKKILRIHRYEAYDENMMRAISPDAWDVIIFVNDNIRMIARQYWKNANIDNTVVISNYIDLYKNDISEHKEPTNKVVYAGYFNARKGIHEIILLAKMMPEFEFHLAGEFQDESLAEYAAANQSPNLFWYPWQDDLAAFYADKTYYINTSISESCCVAMLEAQCCGLKPLVHNWAGSENVYDRKLIWSSIDELKAMMCINHRPEEMRESAIAKNRLWDVMPRIMDIISSPKQEPRMPSVTIAIVKTRNKYMPALLNSLSLQSYPITVDILDNMDKEKSIGRCFNELADRCKTEFICYIGDDDLISEDYVGNVMEAYSRRRGMYPQIAAVITGCTMFDDSGNRAITGAFPTGFWKADYVRKMRFNEQLVRQVDTEFSQRVSQDSSSALLRTDWIVGYYYRQHDKNISGNKLKEGANMSQEPPKEQ